MKSLLQCWWYVIIILINILSSHASWAKSAYSALWMGDDNMLRQWGTHTYQTLTTGSQNYKEHAGDYRRKERDSRCYWINLPHQTFEIRWFSSVQSFSHYMCVTITYIYQNIKIYVYQNNGSFLNTGLQVYTF